MATSSPIAWGAGPVSLRRLTVGDAADLVALVQASLEHLRPWMPWAVDGYGREEARAFLAASGDTAYGIIAGGLLVGVAGVHDRVGPAALEIGYWVAVRHVRRGHATMAAALLTEATVAAPGRTAAHIHTDVANAPSSAVAARLGCRLARTSGRPPVAASETGWQQCWLLTASASPASPAAALLGAARGVA